MINILEYSAGHLTICLPEILCDFLLFQNVSLTFITAGTKLCNKRSVKSYVIRYTK